jgi:hypothetical protein
MFFVGDPGMPDAFSFNKVADFAPRAFTPEPQSGVPFRERLL